MIDNNMRDDIDDFISKANAIISSDYGAFVNFCNSYKAPFPHSYEGIDPFSKDYENVVLKNYLYASKLKDYAPDRDELCNYKNIDAAIHEQFPFSSGDSPTIGRYMMGIGHVMANIGAMKNASIIEYGAGWGHMSFALAQAGAKLRCIDIERGFVDLINRRASKFGSDVHAFHGKFGERPDGEDLVNAIVFYEAFHHALDHAEVLRKCHRSLRPGGRLLLAGEPFYENYEMPWGVRRDGHAVWAVRSFKWMELGFDRKYIVELLTRTGYKVKVLNVPEAGPLGLLYVCEKQEGDNRPSSAQLPRKDLETFAPIARDDYLFLTKKTVLTIADLSDYHALTVSLRNYLTVPLRGRITCAGKSENVIVEPHGRVSVKLSMSHGCGPLHIASETHRPIDLNINDDRRELGLCVEGLEYH